MQLFTKLTCKCGKLSYIIYCKLNKTKRAPASATNTSKSGRNGEVAGCHNPNIPRHNIKIKPKEDVMSKENIYGVKGGCEHSSESVVFSAFVVGLALLVGVVELVLAALIA